MSNHELKTPVKRPRLIMLGHNYILSNSLFKTLSLQDINIYQQEYIIY